MSHYKNLAQYSGCFGEMHVLGRRLLPCGGSRQLMAPNSNIGGSSVSPLACMAYSPRLVLQQSSRTMATIANVHRMTAKTLSEKILAERDAAERSFAIIDVRDDGEFAAPTPQRPSHWCKLTCCRQITLADTSRRR